MSEPNIMVEWLAASLYIQKVCGTHLTSGMRCADYIFYFIFFSPFRQMPGLYLRLSNRHFLILSSLFINYATIQFSIVRASVRNIK